jgi:hypothetical protein
VVGKPVPFFANIPANSGLHLLPIPFTKQFADYYTLGELTSKDYPHLIPDGQKVDTIAVPTVLAVYYWPKGSDRYRRVERFTERLFANTRVLLPDLAAGEMAIQRQRVRPARSLDPEFVPAPPVPLRSRSWLGVSFVAGILAFALIAFIAIDRFLPIPTASRQQASDRTVDLNSFDEGYRNRVPAVAAEGIA